MAVPLPHLFIYLSPLELPDLFISSINYLTFSSTSLSLSHFELPDLFISPINYTPNFLFKSYVWFFFSLHVVHTVLLFVWVSKVHFFPFGFWLALLGFMLLFIYLFIFLFCSIFLFGLLCSLFCWFYNFLVLKFFSSNILIVVLTSFVFLFILMLYNIKLIRLDIFLVHRMSLRLVLKKAELDDLCDI